MEDVYIVAAKRTAVGKAPRGVFAKTRPDDLLAHAIKAALQTCPQLDHHAIDDAIIGCAMPEAEQGMNVARNAVLFAGLPVSVAGVTINRFCSSGLQAIAFAANRIRAGEADLMIAGGIESMSMVPMMGHKPALNIRIFQDDNIGIAYGMGLTAEKVAEQFKVSRKDQDAFALQSHQKAIAAQERGDFAEEIAPYEVVLPEADLQAQVIQNRRYMVEHDEGPRRDTTLEKLSRLKPVFAVKGTVTAGNSSQMSDGAGALLLASEKAVKLFDLEPLARFAGFSVAGVPPEIMGIGPKEAIPKVLKQTGLALADIDWIELNEAFAAQSIAVIRETGLDAAKVNPLGGAIALGHPLGATGAIRAATIVHGLQKTKQRYGMVTMCIGVGMGAAGIFERV